MSNPKTRQIRVIDGENQPDAWRRGSGILAAMRGAWDIRVPSDSAVLLQTEEPTIAIAPAGAGSGTFRAAGCPQAEPSEGRQLAIAAGAGRRDLIEPLLNTGADPNVHLDNGWTALMCAAIAGHVEIVQDLLIAGADPDIEAGGRTALDLAVEAQAQSVIDFLRARQARELRWSDKRGVKNFDLRQSIVLIRGSIDDAIRAIGDSVGFVRREINVQGKNITSTQECCLVFQFTGHAWSALIPICTAVPECSLQNPNIARAISIAITDASVLYVNRDDRLSYELCERGQIVEYLNCGPVDPVEASRPVSFRSLRRNVSPALLGYPEQLVDAFVRDLGTLIPGIAFRCRPGVNLHVLPELRRDDFERIDYLVIH